VETRRQAFEEAIIANFGDLATHAAYADLLQEEGDPHGEFIAVQLALEDERLASAQRRSLAAREKELLDEHAPQWLGRIARYVGTAPGEGLFRFSRGWLETVHVRRATYRFVEGLAHAPLARFLQRLEIDYGYEDPQGEWDDERQEMFPPLPIPAGTPEENEFYLPLREAPFLATLRYLRIGEIHGGGEPHWWFHSSGSAELLDRIVERAPRLEELHMLNRTRGDPRFDPSPVFRSELPNLRVLRAYNLFDHASAVLAANASLKSLRQLMFHSHADDPCFPQRGPYLTASDLRNVLRSEHLQGLTHLEFRLSNIGDEGCAEIVHSGALKRLKVLDLRHGSITDEGVRLLVSSGDLRNLTRLDVSRNTLSARGVEMLTRSGVPFEADGQHATGDADWLIEGDWE
jgi:uncharacterized protein (TIGR02996 family)